jgi:hypothetical protein
MEHELQTYYDNEAAAGARAAMGSRGRRDDLRAAFVAQLAAEQRVNVVEVGSGPGTDATAFLEAGVNYAGFDLAVGNSKPGCGSCRVRCLLRRFAEACSRPVGR